MLYLRFEGYRATETLHLFLKVMNNIDYKKIVDDAMRSVVRRIISKIKDDGLGEGQHCYITFQTHFPDVILAETMREKYPDEITIVLQHQFWNLQLDEKGFFVDLSFDNKRQTVFVPLKAVTYFLDPSDNFAISLEKIDWHEEQELECSIENNNISNVPTASQSESNNNVISLDVFRKKSD